jgi:hypothetical protein
MYHKSKVNHHQIMHQDIEVNLLELMTNRAVYMDNAP